MSKPWRDEGEATTDKGALAPIDGVIPEGTAHLAFDPARTRIYADSWLTERSA